MASDETGARGEGQDGADVDPLIEELFAARRQALVGKLAGVLAHDFNNVLTAVLGYTEMLLGDAEEDHPWRADLQEVYSSGQRAAQLTRRLLAFNRLVVVSPQLLSWAQLLDELAPMLRPVLGEQIRFDVRVAPEAATSEVVLDKGQASEVVFTAAWLARSTFPGNGVCQVTVGAPSAGGTGKAPGAAARQDIRIDAYLDPGTTFTAEASDAIASSLRHLAGVVERGGGVFSSSASADSWSITASYPLEAAAARAPEPAAPSVQASGRLVLVAEDEELLRQVVRRMLERSGFVVVEGASGEEALAAMEAAGRPPDVVVTDVVMPGMSGVDMAERVVARHPGVRVLYISGYTDAASVGLPTDRFRASFLPKPFTREQLLRAINELFA